MNDIHVNHEVDDYRWFTPVEARVNIRRDIARWFLEKYLEEAQ